MTRDEALNGLEDLQQVHIDGSQTMEGYTAWEVVMHINKIYNDLEYTLKEMMEVQKSSITDEYMKGLYNGMAFSLSMINGEEPEYIENVERWKQKDK